MIGMMDEIVLRPADVSTVIDALHHRYLPAVNALGIQLQSQSFYPPVPSAEGHSTLCLQWSYPDDIYAFWLSRSGFNEAMAEYWQLVDHTCLSRQRHTLGVGESLTLPAASDYDVVHHYNDKQPSATRRSAQLYLRDNADRQQLEQALAGIPQLQFSENIEGSVGAGNYTLDLLDAEQSSIKELIAGLAGIESLDEVCYQPLLAGLREPELQHGIWRTLFLQVKPGTPEQALQAFVDATAQMPFYIDTIRNWSLSTVTSGGPWTHVWQQEYNTIDGLMGEYMCNAYHWGWIDHWFNPEFPDCIVDLQLSHAFCPLANSYLSQCH